MASEDDLALLKRMYDRRDISADQYDTLRRHVLWGTPLRQLMDQPPAADRPGGRHSSPNGTGYSPPATPNDYTPTGRRYASRRERREAEEAATQLPPPPQPAFPPPTDSPAFRQAEAPTFPPPAKAPPFRPPAEPTTFAPPAEAPAFRPPAEPTAFPLPEESPPFRPAEPTTFAPAASRPPAEFTTFAPPADVPAFRTLAYSPVAAFPVAGSDQDEFPLADTKPGEESVRRRRSTGEDDERPARKHPHRRSLLAVLTSLVVSLALVAAGVWWFEIRTEGVPPSAYARETCGSVRDWQQAVDTSNAALVNQIAREKDPTKIRNAVSAYYTTIAARTDQLRVTILGHGAASLDGGRTYADSLAAAIGDRARDLRDLAARAARLDPTDKAFQTTLPTLLTGADTAVSEVSAALARPSAGISTDLRTALSDDPSCAPYVG